MNELVTIVGASYFEPITKLFEELERHYKGHEGEIQAGTFVNGYAASICLLSVVCLESYAMRARYIHGATGDELNKLPVTKYLKKYTKTIHISMRPMKFLLLEIFLRIIICSKFRMIRMNLWV